MNLTIVTVPSFPWAYYDQVGKSSIIQLDVITESSVDDQRTV